MARSATSKTAKPKPLLAYSVTEPNENTGGIVFATSAVAARRIGADQYCDGEFAYAQCRRAPFADRFADTGIVPAAALIDAGWHFECIGCGVRIDTDLSERWKDDAGPTDSFHDLLIAGRRYRGWTPSDVLGHQHGAVFCDAACEQAHLAHEAERKRCQDRAIAAFKRIVAKRFPDATFPDDGATDDTAKPRWQRHHHAYAEIHKGRWRLRQIIVAFSFPGMIHGHAQLTYDLHSRRSRAERKPIFLCCAGDKEVFEAWAALHPPKETGHV